MRVYRYRLPIGIERQQVAKHGLAGVQMHIPVHDPYTLFQLGIFNSGKAGACPPPCSYIFSLDMCRAGPYHSASCIANCATCRAGYCEPVIVKPRCIVYSPCVHAISL